MHYISATSLKDFIACSMRYHWRMTKAEEAVTSAEMRAGSIVHTILEKFWDKTKEHNLTKAYALAEVNNIPDKLIDRIGQSITSYHTHFSHLLTDKDKIEFNFRLLLDSEVTLLGKMDRVVEPAGLILDWKTSEYNVMSINDDIQFLIYYYAYTRLNNHPPSLVAYVSLMHNKLVSLDIKRSNYEYLINDVLPGVIIQIKQGNFYRSGVFNKKCTDCQYKEICLEK